MSPYRPDQVDVPDFLPDNEETRGEGTVHAEDSKVQVLVIPTNEELVIARDAKEVYTEHQKKRVA